MLLSCIVLLFLLPANISAQTLPLSLTVSKTGLSCTCQSDYDCQKPVCSNIDPNTYIGTCAGGPLDFSNSLIQSTAFPSPDIANITGGSSCMCQTDYDCQKPVCYIDPITKVGTCIDGPLQPPTSTRLPTRLPTRRPTKVPTKVPTNTPTINAPIAKAPENAPTKTPTKVPTKGPTKAPTKAPTLSLTKAPTKVPTMAPTMAPTESSTRAPTKTPTRFLTKSPTKVPTTAPTVSSTRAPTKDPTNSPTKSPTKAPIPSSTNTPTKVPTMSPTESPTKAPTRAPIQSLTKAPTKVPTTAPTMAPTKSPTQSLTKAPTSAPTNFPTSAPTKSPARSLTKAPTKSPTQAPTRPFTSAPTKVPTMAPISAKPVSENCCVKPRNIPTKCEVDILIELLDIAISSEHKLAAQWLRLAFHDAGTFDKATNEGGAKGCLMNDPNFRNEPENAFLDIPINTLMVTKMAWEAHANTCIAISGADIIQFAGLFASLRQVPPAGVNPTKRETLMQFEWGRIDEIDCDLNSVNNLPNFRATPSSQTRNLILRCQNAGGEIKTKMMDRNGFTAEESAALVGAHTIGLTRNSFPVSNPWVQNGADSATPSGPVFDNAYHDFLTNTVVANTAPAFSRDQNPFDTVFPDWFLDNSDKLSHLDTDIALAFPSRDLSVHPSFHIFTAAFANDNALFLRTFFSSLDKMGKLGVRTVLSSATECTSCDGNGKIGDAGVAVSFVSNLGSAKAGGEVQLALRKQSQAVKALFEADAVPL